MATLLSVVTLVLSGQPITPVNVFMMLGFMDIARSVTCLFISSALLLAYEAYASLRRIEDFLLLENLPAILLCQPDDSSNTESSSAKVTSGPSDRQAKMEIVFT